ncbi:hypothetical protein ABB30_12975 [Stenotrophomonas ginsengisoli]|uniref:Glycosyltransferase RgtA/B/C/D-like domain-containing protein n=1 Tax=Stenotrophomonas ginsengisoli TaxID=336566 RepID=A0A0R0DA61_9GAMM|nr:hypothetical protein [Stenotrophomonas ginsengisoli]KRG75015.1 hypothetical protein ABB30_12975 [Stenotrophomonas ginsengisoli]
MQASKAAGAGWKQGLAGLAMVLLTAAVYWPGLSGPFLFDDFPALVSNARVHVVAGDWPGLWRAATSFDPGGTGRQLAMASFGLNHMLGGLEPWGWKLGGLLVHLLNALLVYVLCLRLLALAGVQQWLRLSAFAVALLWAVHPLQVSTVLYVVQRMETLCLTFTLLALLAYLRARSAQIAGGRGWPWLLGCALCFVLALGAKESALLLPLYTLALELSLLGFAGNTVGQRRFWRWGYAAGSALGVLLFVTVIVPHYGSLETITGRDFNTVERVLSQLRILPMHLGQMLLPLPASMTFYYDDFIASTTLLQPWTTLAGGLLLAGLLALAWWLRRRAPLTALGIFWFFAAHAITSSVVPLELVFEHRNYFALLGVLLVLADIVRRIPVRDGPGIKIAGVAAAIVLFGLLAMVRSATWGDRLLLATEFVATNPQSPRAAHELGVLYYEMADGSANSPFFSLAVNTFEREAGLPKASILAEQSLILMHAGQGLPVEPRWWSGLHRRLQEQPVTPQTTAALFGLLGNRVNKGVELDDRALDQAFMLMFERVSMPPNSYFDVAMHALDYSHDEPLARSLLMQAVSTSAEYPHYVPVMAGVLREKGRDDLAEWIVVKSRE